MPKQASLSLQTIILAAAGVLVLSIIAVLVIGAGESTDNAVSCTTQGGRCVEGGCEDIDDQIGEGNLCGDGQTCCEPI